MRTPIVAKAQRLAIFCVLASFATPGSAAPPAVAQLLANAQEPRHPLVSQANPDNHPDVHSAAAARAQFAHAVGLLGSGQARAAEAAFKRLAQAHPNWPGPANNLAVIYARRGDYQAARHWLERALDSNAVYATAYANLRDVYAALAAAAYRDALGKGQQPDKSPINLALVPHLGPATASHTKGLVSQARPTPDSGSALDAAGNPITPTDTQRASDKLVASKSGDAALADAPPRIDHASSPRDSDGNLTPDGAPIVSAQAADVAASGQADSASMPADQVNSVASSGLALAPAGADSVAVPMSDSLPEIDIPDVAVASAEASRAPEEAIVSADGAAVTKPSAAAEQPPQPEPAAQQAPQWGSWKSPAPTAVASADDSRAAKAEQIANNALPIASNTAESDTVLPAGKHSPAAPVGETTAGPPSTTGAPASRPSAETLITKLDPQPTDEPENADAQTGHEPAATVSRPQDEDGNVTTRGDETAARATVERWRAAWDEQNVSAYLAQYAPGFRPDSGISVKQWRAQRRTRINTPDWIKIELRDVELFPLSENRLRASFVQTYRSDGYSDRVLKSLILIRTPAGWRILREAAIPYQR